MKITKVKEVAFGDNVIISEWFVDYTHADWGKVTHDSDLCAAVERR